MWEKVFATRGRSGKLLSVNRGGENPNEIEIFIGDIESFSDPEEDSAGIDDFTVEQMHVLGQFLIELKKE